MISDSQLYTLAIFLGSAAMLLIVLYHFLEVNAVDSDEALDLQKDTTGVGAVKAPALATQEKGTGGPGGEKGHKTQKSVEKSVGAGEEDLPRVKDGLFAGRRKYPNEVSSA